MWLKNLSILSCLLITATTSAQSTPKAQSKQEKLKHFTETLEQRIEKDAQVDSMRYWKGKPAGRAPASIGDNEEKTDEITPVQRQRDAKEMYKKQDLNMNNQTGLESL